MLRRRYAAARPAPIEACYTASRSFAEGERAVAEMDQGIKRLIQSHPQDILALAVPEATYLGTLPVDVATEPQLTLDTLLRARIADVECAVDIEAEARPHAEIARRLFEYGARATIITGLPILSVVLWLEPGGLPPLSPYELRLGERPILAWHYIGVEVYKLSAQSLLTTALLGLAPLVAFTQEAREIATVERAAEFVKAHAASGEVEELEALLAVFGARTFGAEAMRQLIRRLFMSTEIIGTSPLYQEWIQEATEKGMARGIEQGRELGLEQGRELGLEQGLRTALLAMLSGRFGTLPPEMERAIEGAETGTLQAVLPRAGLDSLDELRARLGV